jgi:hypothetical protein
MRNAEKEMDVLCKAMSTIRRFVQHSGIIFLLTNLAQAQSRARQENQVAMLRGIKGDMSGMPQNYQMMMRGQNGLNMQQNNELRQKAIQNNRNG